MIRFLPLPRSAARIRTEIDEEIRFDIDMRARDLMQLGISADAAHARAAHEFGDLDGTRRYCEDIDMQIEAEVRRSHFSRTSARLVDLCAVCTHAGLLRRSC
jgi:hypothetical protein